MNVGSTALPRSGYQPALDGLRAVAVALVLFFHGGFSWMTGGYVGVSVFFTLSGFLITRQLLAEHHSSCRVDIRAFWVRRVRRLMPASLLCLLLVSIAAALGEFGGLPHVRRDVLAALLQVANWNALAGGTSYADLVASAAGQLGPVDHFWSLSVEEQFYWVWPAVCALLFAGRARRAVVRWLVGLAVGGVAAAFVVAWVWGADAAYWATPARLGEILVGAALAGVLSTRGIGRRAGGLVGAVGVAGLAVVLIAAVTWPAGSGPAYGGWLGVFALASAALILGLQVPGPLRTAFSFGPLVHLGRISYGLYLFHWPVFALLSAGRVGLDGWSLFGVRMAATLAVAEASFHLLEQPLRHGVAAHRRVAAVTAATAALVGVAVVALVPSPRPAFSGAGLVPATFAPVSTASASSTTSVPVSSAAVASSTLPDSVESSSSAPSTAPAASLPSATRVPDSPVSVLVLGDSTAVALADGMFQWSAARPDQLQVASLARLGCGLVRNSSMWGDDDGTYSRGCEHAYSVELPTLLAQRVPDVVMIMVTIPDVLGRVWDESEGALLPRDRRYSRRLAADYRAMADTLVAAGVRHISWVVPPLPSDKWPQAKVNPIAEVDWQ
ncbi:MAG: acyltransferase family protein, partial [Actinomycetota bacterium]